MITHNIKLQEIDIAHMGICNLDSFVLLDDTTADIHIVYKVNASAEIYLK